MRGNAEEMAGWAPTAGSWSARGIFQQPGLFPLRSVGSKPQAGLPSLQHQSQKGTQKTPSYEKQQGFCQPGRETAGDSERLLKSQCTKFYLQPHTLGSSRGRAEWTRDTRGESGAGGSGERTEGTATRIPVLSHSPYCRSHLSQAEHSYK